MINGATSWPAFDAATLTQRTIAGRPEIVFQDAAPSLYMQLAQTAACQPEATALVDERNRTLTYAELKERVDSLASHLAYAYGIKAADHVALLMRASVEYVCAIYALNRLGAVCVALPTKYRCQEVIQLMYLSDISLVIADERYRAWAPQFPVVSECVIYVDETAEAFGLLAKTRATKEAPLVAQEEATAFMLFTSGTTSQAKVVELKNYNVVHAAMVYAALMETTSEDKTLICLPIYYVTGLIALLAQFIYVGGTVYLQRTFEPAQALATVLNQNLTYLHCSPTAFAKLLQYRASFPELPSLKHLLSGSSRESQQVMAAYAEWLPHATYQVVYGLTESSSPALLFPGDTPRSSVPDATGKPFPGIAAKIVAADGHECASGEPGELWLKGTTITRSYYRQKVEALHEDGWFQTGDVAYAHEDGLIWVVDRLKDMINRGGEKVWCSSLEDALLKIDGVKASCVSRLDHDVYGEVPVAAVVVEPESHLTEHAIKEVLGARLARFEVPEHVIFVEHIPETAAGKPNRRAVTQAVQVMTEGRKAS